MVNSSVIKEIWYLIEECNINPAIYIVCSALLVIKFTSTSF